MELQAATPALTDENVVDLTFSITQSDWIMEVTAEINGKMVKVEVRRNFYEMQSWAKSSILTTEAGYQTLLIFPAPRWFADTAQISYRNEDQVKQVLGQVARNLLIRAARVLGAAA